MNSQFDRMKLIDRVKKCLEERTSTEVQRRAKKFDSIVDYVDHLNRLMETNPTIAEALQRFQHSIKNFRSPTDKSSNISLEISAVSSDQMLRVDSDLDQRSNVSEISLHRSQSTESNRYTSIEQDSSHVLISQSQDRSKDGLLSKSTRKAISKIPRQRSRKDIELLEHIVRRFESLRHFPMAVRYYAARSAVLVISPENTIVANHFAPSLVVYLVVDGQCRLVLDTEHEILATRTLFVGDTYGEECLRYSMTDRVFSLMTGADRPCTLVAIFPREIRAHELYMSDMFKNSLLLQLREQQTFVVMQWRQDLFDYFLKYSNYRQYNRDDIIYGNETVEHEQLYFILSGHVSLVRLFEFSTFALKYPQWHQFHTRQNHQNTSMKSSVRNVTRKHKSIPNTDQSIEEYSHLVANSLNNNEHVFDHEIQSISDDSPVLHQQRKSSWRFLEVFMLSEGHYFGFETSTRHSWYLCRNVVDVISISKQRFRALGCFAPFILEKLRQDFLDSFPDESFIRNSYLNSLQMNPIAMKKIDGKSLNRQRKQFQFSQYETDILQKLNWIPTEKVLRMLKIFKQKSTFSRNPRIF